MTAAVAERGSAAARTPSAHMGRDMLLGWPERAADPALRLHGNKIGWRWAGLEALTKHSMRYVHLLRPIKFIGNRNTLPIWTSLLRY